MHLSILAFALGVFALQMQAELPGSGAAVLLAAAGLGGLLLSLRRSPRLSRSILLLSCAALGYSWGGWRAQERLADHLPEEWERQDIVLVGTVAELPQRFDRGQRFVFDVDSVLTPGAVVPGRISLSWYSPREEFADEKSETAGPAVRPGERWRFTVRLKRPHGNANPHGFDYEAWLLERGIRATGTIRAREATVRLEKFVKRPGYAIERLRDSLRERFLQELPDAPYVGVLTALAIGDQRIIPVEQWQIFNRTGITHLVSISGLHVTMIAALVAALVNFLWRRSESLALRLPAQKAAIAAGWLAAMGYALLAGFAVPAQRTAFMLSVLALALWSGRNLGVVRTLLLALFLVLLFDPWAVLATGFWLSFGAVAVLFFVSGSRLGGKDGKENGERRWLAGLKQWGIAQWAITVGGLPLLLLFFQQFSLVSPLANAVAIPVVSFVITPLALIYALLPWPPLLHLDHWLLSQLMALLEYLAFLPVWQQPAPPWWVVPIALSGVFWLLLPRGFPARWLGVCLLLPALLLPAPRPPSGEAWVDVLDVGQGLAILVRTSKHALLYDTGPSYGGEANAGQRVVVPFLRAAGVSRLDTLMVSHRDKDHSGGMEAVQGYGPIGRIATSALEFGGEPCALGQAWEWDGVRFTILHPRIEDYARTSKKPNNMSCVLRVENDYGSILLTADIEVADERSLLARAPGLLRSDVLVVPHHGGKGSSSPGFVAAVAPREAVFSVGYRNSFRHPRPEVLERYSASRHWRTDLDGAIRIALGPGVAVSAWRENRQRYWHNRVGR